MTVQPLKDAAQKCVSRRKEELFPPEKIFLFALLSGLVMAILSLCFIQDIYRDCAGAYAYYARELAWNGLAAGWVGRVPMLHILLSGCLAKAGLTAYAATIVVSSLFYILTLFPLRRLLERYTTPWWAAWGCVLYVLAPKIIRESVTGLLEPTRIFFLTCSLLFLFQSTEKGKTRHALLLGGALAMLSVSRGEGLPAALGLWVVLPCLWKLKKTPVPGRKMLLNWAAATVTFLLLLTPFCYGNWHFNRALVPDTRMVSLRSPSPKITTQPITVKKEEEEGEEKNWFQKWLDKHPTPERILTTLNHTVRGAYEIYLPLAVLGIFLLLRQKQWRWDYTLFLGLYAGHTLIYYVVSSDYRYNVYLVPLFMPFTLAGIAFLWEEGKKLLSRYLPAGQWKFVLPLLLLGTASLLLYQAENGLAHSFNRKDAAIRKMAEELKKQGDRLCPGRRCRLAALDQPETVYWSGMTAVFSYRSGQKPLTEFRDYDFLLLAKNQILDEARCPWLKKIPLSAELAEHFQLYRMTQSD